MGKHLDTLRVFEPAEPYQRVRLGVNRDGGYVVVELQEGARKPAAIYGYGVGGDVSFESTACLRYGCKAYLHDHTVGLNRMPLPQMQHVLKGMDSGHGTFRDYVTANGDVGKCILFKADVEGAEYGFIEKEIDDFFTSHVEQIILEVHFPDNEEEVAKRMATLEKLLSKYNIVHAHINNYGYGMHIGSEIIYGAYELTMLRKDLCEFTPNTIAMPILGIDFANNPAKPDVCGDLMNFTQPCQPGRLITVGRGCGVIGDTIMVAHICQILRDNGYDAVLKDRPPFAGILTVPHGDRGEYFHAAYEKSDRRLNIVGGLLHKFADEMHVPVPVIKRNRPPLRIIDDPSILGVDVAMSTQVGYWCDIKNWPYFNDLKNRLTKEGISWIDVNELDFGDVPENDRPYAKAVAVQNIIRKSKVFVGLDTGTAHIAAGCVMKGRGIILQSGYTHRDYWSAQYGDIFDYIEYKMPCSGCFNRKYHECDHNHECMRCITVDMVHDAILQRLR